MKWLLQSRKLRNVDRCSLLSVIKKQNVAEHSYYVAMIAIEIAKQYFPEPNLGILLQKALFHDLEETETGDLPYTFKQFPVVKNAAKEYKRDFIQRHFSPNHIDSLSSFNFKVEDTIVKIADYMELYMYVSEERVIGNKSKEMSEVSINCIDIISNLCFENDGLGKIAFKMLGAIDRHYSGDAYE